MMCRKSIGIVVLLTVFYQRQSVVCRDQIVLVHTLNALLAFPGWGRIEYPKAVYQVDGRLGYTYSGAELFINMIDQEPASVNGENVNEKYYKTVTLLGCVYANVMFDFFNLMENILKTGDGVARRLKKRANNMDRYRRIMHEKGKKLVGVRRQLYPLDQHMWEILTFAVGLLKIWSPMFDRMYEALTFFTGFVSAYAAPDKPTTAQPVQLVITGLMEIREITRDIHKLLPTHNGVYRSDDDANVVSNHNILKKFLIDQNTMNVCPFAYSFCVQRQNPSPIDFDHIALLGRRHFTRETLQTMESLAKEYVDRIVKDYYTDLGFENKWQIMVPTASQDRIVLDENIN